MVGSDSTAMSPGTMSAVMKFFGMRAGEFRKEWAELSETDREELKTGVGNGSLTY